jgi:hypothetical protein
MRVIWWTLYVGFIGFGLISGGIFGASYFVIGFTVASMVFFDLTEKTYKANEERLEILSEVLSKKAEDIASELNKIEKEN